MGAGQWTWAARGADVLTCEDTGLPAVALASHWVYCFPPGCVPWGLCGKGDGGGLREVEGRAMPMRTPPRTAHNRDPPVYPIDT